VGFADLASSLIMFISVLVVTAGIAGLMLTNMQIIGSSSSQSQQYVENQIKTEITVDHAYFNTSTEVLTLFVKNTGQTSLDINKLTLYIDDAFYLVNSTSAPAVIEPDTNDINEAYFDNNEVLRITLDLTGIDPGVHTVKVITTYDNSATSLFSS